MSYVWEVAKYPIKSKVLAELLLKFDTVLGLEIDKKNNNVIEEIPEKILKLVEKRKQAKLDRNWELSDELRKEIEKNGYNIKDTKDGIVIQKK